MTDYHVGCGLFGIYAGTLTPNGDKWRNKSDVTKECLNATAQYLLEQGVYMQFENKGKTYIMEIREVTEEEKQK